MTAITESPNPTERQPITDVQAWLAALPGGDAPNTLRVLGELLLGVTDRAKDESANRFTTRCLGVSGFSEIVD